MTRTELLEKARTTVCGDREQDYGSPENSFQRISEFWGTYLNQQITSVDVAAMMALLKLARVAEGHAKEDNWVDLAGYAACGAEIESGSGAEGEDKPRETVHDRVCKSVVPECLCNTCKNDNDDNPCCFREDIEMGQGHNGSCGGVTNCPHYEKEE